MDARYTELYRLPNELYANGYPIMVVAGTLLKDNKNGKVLVQLKLKNIGAENIISCKVSISAYETNGNETTGLPSFSYLDLNIKSGEDFGTKIPIYLPDNNSRRYNVFVSEAVTENGTVIISTGEKWKPIPRPQLLSEYFNDDELSKQYGIESGGNCTFKPAKTDGLFLCSCGTITLESVGKCCICSRTYDNLSKNLDLSFLTEKKDNRLKEEAVRRENARIAQQEKEAEEQRQKDEKIRLEHEEYVRKEKRRKRKKITVVLLSLSVIAIVIACSILIPLQKYNSAIELMNGGQYEKAMMSFSELGNYNDSKQKAADCNIFHLKEIRERNNSKIIPTIAGDDEHFVGIQPNGTVVSYGYNEHGGCNVSGWTNIIAVYANSGYTVGLKSDGTVVYAGDNNDFKKALSQWDNVVDISISTYGSKILGLKSDGTAVCVEKSDNSDSSYWGSKKAIIPIGQTLFQLNVGILLKQD